MPSTGPADGALADKTGKGAGDGPGGTKAVHGHEGGAGRTRDASESVR